MNMPDAWKTHVEHIQNSTWCPSDDAAMEIMDLMKEMAETLDKSSCFVPSMCGTAWMGSTTSFCVRCEILEKFKEWK